MKHLREFDYRSDKPSKNHRVIIMVYKQLHGEEYSTHTDSNFELKVNVGDKSNISTDDIFYTLKRGDYDIELSPVIDSELRRHLIEEIRFNEIGNNIKNGDASNLQELLSIFIMNRVHKRTDDIRASVVLDGKEIMKQDHFTLRRDPTIKKSAAYESFSEKKINTMKHLKEFEEIVKEVPSISVSDTSIEPKTIKKADNGNFIGKMFQIRDIAHLLHLKSNSYSEHIALNLFYDEILPFTDSVAEMMQNTELLDIRIPASLIEKSPIDYISTFRNEVQEFRDGCSSDDVIATLDEVIELCNSTLYKLKFLN